MSLVAARLDHQALVVCLNTSIDRLPSIFKLTNLWIVDALISLLALPRSVLLLTHESDWELPNVDRSIGTCADILLVDDVVNLLFVLVCRAWICDRPES